MRMPAPSRTPIPHRRRPTIGASAMMSPPREAGDSLARWLSIGEPRRSGSPRGAAGRGLTPRADPWAAGQVRLGRPSWPDYSAGDLDHDERDEAAEQHVAEVMAAEGEPQEACAESEGERRDHCRSTPGWGQHARRRDHPESGRCFAGDERTVLLASAVIVIPWREGIRPVEVLGLARAGTMPMILEAKIDDEARADDHRGDEKDHSSAARRPGKPDPPALPEP